jgi:protein-L-isoaspartate(D-aspartate) O-methyltransferase
MNPTLDISRARFNMIEQQIRPWDVLDQEVLDLLSVVRREEFVPAAHRLHAFTDVEIPLVSGTGSSANSSACMWTPKMEARVLQELQVRGHDRALEIGAGSGYFAALLAHRCHAVTTLEIVPQLATMAEQNLRQAGISNAKVRTADGARGFGSERYDVIVLSGSVPAVPAALLEQLAPGGRLFAVTGDAPAMLASVYTRNALGIAQAELFETVIAPLANAEPVSRFRF